MLVKLGLRASGCDWGVEVRVDKCKDPTTIMQSVTSPIGMLLLCSQSPLQLVCLVSDGLSSEPNNGHIWYSGKTSARLRRRIRTTLQNTLTITASPMQSIGRFPNLPLLLINPSISTYIVPTRDQICPLRLFSLLVSLDISFRFL